MSPLGYLQSQVSAMDAGSPLEANELELASDWVLQSDWPMSLGWWFVLVAATIGLLIGLELWRAGTASNESQQISNWKRWGLVGLRVLTVAVVLLMLGRWQLARYEVDLPDLVILVDHSESMSMQLEYAGDAGQNSAATSPKTRIDAAKEVLTEGSGKLLRSLASEYRLRISLIGETTQPLAGEVASLGNQLERLNADSKASRLGLAIADAVRGQRGRSTAAIVLVSDGVVTDGISLQQSAEQAAAARLPVFAIKTGSEYPPPQVAIEELLADSAAMVGDLVRVLARVRWESSEQNGLGQNRLAIRLRDAESNRVLAEEGLTIASGRGSGQVELMFTASEPGLRRLKVEVEQVAGEVDFSDNVAETTVDIRDESFRVLLVQGAASYEFRFLKHLLERATSRDGSRPLVELISVLQTGDPRYADQDKTARRLPPVDDETLNKLDLIILSDCDPQGFGRVLQNRIVDLVTGKGTSLIIIAGPDHLPGKLAGTPLESLLPVELSSVLPPVDASQGLAWELTSLGSSVASLQVADPSRAWKDAPPLYWLARATRLRPGARVLLEASDQAAASGRVPILVSQLAGNGQVWLQLTDESFRLRAADMDAEMYERYWLQTVRTLAQGRQVSEADDASLDVVGQNFPAGSAIPFEVRLGAQLASIAGGQVTISVTDEGGLTETFTGELDSAGKGYRGLIQNLPAGGYRAVLAAPLGSGDPASDAFVVLPGNQESAVATVDLVALQRLAETSGGGLLDISEVTEKLGSLLPKGRAMRIRALEPVVIWNHWLVCCLLFGLLSLQWILRRYFGGL